MFTKTICTPGSTINVVPEGLLAVLKYNSNGQLEAIQLGYDPMNYQCAPKEVVDTVKVNHLAPTNINIFGGTSYVYGVFYSEDDIVTSGNISTCLRETYLQKIITSPKKFKFYASHPTSLAANFKSLLAIRNWLELNGFFRVPSIVAPTEVNDDTMLDILCRRFNDFRWPLMSGYWIEKDNKMKFIPSNQSQFKIKKVTSVIDSKGIVTGEVKLDSGVSLSLPWSTIIDFDLDNDTTILLENEKILMSRRHTNKPRDIRSREYVCPVCGKKQIIEYNQGAVECDDNNCKSKLFTKISQFIRVLGLPEMTYDEYKKLEASGDVTCITDLFSLPKYKDEIIRCTLPKLLESVVSPIAVPNTDIFQKFADSCSNTLNTLDYYLHSPMDIPTDLNISSAFTPRFVDWLQQPYNILMMDTLLCTPQIQITYSGKRFEGAPIFRGKKICVTGEFLHGSLTEIISILKSYDAEVTTVFSDSIHCVIIGAKHSDIDGGIVQAARQIGAPVFEESEFFAKYEIDADLNENLQ